MKNSGRENTSFIIYIEQQGETRRIEAKAIIDATGTWSNPNTMNADNIFVHDGARPFIEETTIERALEGVRKWEACVVGVPVKDTIKIVDECGFAEHTPDRSFVWAVQTPQVFKREILVEAYQKLMTLSEVQVTDDAMVVEQMLNKKVKLVEGSYKNIKITTPEDLIIGEQYLR